MSERLEDWIKFSTNVCTHIEDYTVPQYGDKGEDQISDYTADDCVKQIKKYLARFGKNAREGQEKLDLLKIAHYVQLAYDKLEG